MRAAFDRPPATQQAPGTDDKRDLWEPLSKWLLALRAENKVEFLAGRTAGYVYFQLGLHRDAHSIWSNTVHLAPNSGTRSGVRRDMAHALFREHDIRGAVSENARAMDDAVQEGDRLGQAQCLFGQGSVPVAWPLSEPVGFLLAGHRLRKAAGIFHSVKTAVERSPEQDPSSKAWIQATFGEATCLYWLARWEQRWLALLLPISKPLRDHLARLYERAKQLLENERVNAVNELVNPLRSLALVRVRDNPQEAQEHALAARRLVQWTGDRQRLSTVLRDVAQVYLLSGTSSDLHTALRYWAEALLAASEGSGARPSDLIDTNAVSVASNIISVLQAPDPGRSLADVNGVSQALYGLAATLARIGDTRLSEADKIVRGAIAVVSQLSLPKGSKRIHLLRFRLLLLKWRFNR